MFLKTDGAGNLSFDSLSFSTPLAVIGNATAGSEIRLPEDTDNGSNYVAIKAPDTIASNLTLTLPSADGSSGQVLQTNGSGVLSFGSSGGITEADQWRLTSDLTLANDVDTVISANLERVDTDGFGLLGTGMTESSGVFTFPSTGYWYVSFNARGTGTGIDAYTVCILQTTTDGTNFDNASQASASVPVANHFFNVSGNFIFDCTNTTTHKIRFRQYANGSFAKFAGDTAVNNTYFTFIKLAQT